MIESTAIVGDARSMEAVIAETLAVSRLAEYFSTLQDLLESESASPNLILVLQQWPDEYRASEIDALFRQFPLSRVLCCYGVWCSSMRRTRSVWPAVVCTSEDEFLERLKLEVRVIQEEIPPLPLTAGLDELFGYVNAHAESES
ncbi:hypothetical protein AB1L42_18285 [Thalassoglobus sp. JC818]|uniref:hypothetical protein n=1 Tax=Thalassoglobus sp. JC818 TaxID=3232136 RepID=UPI0034592665